MTNYYRVQTGSDGRLELTHRVAISQVVVGDSTHTVLAKPGERYFGVHCVRWGSDGEPIGWYRDPRQVIKVAVEEVKDRQEELERIFEVRRKALEEDMARLEQLKEAEVNP